MFIANRQPQPGESTHRGFTLVEILIAIVIITILIGLLMPAIVGVRLSTRIAQVKGEISDLETAIAQFKVKYGMEPPSRIILSAPGNNWDVRSASYIRRMWPQFDFNISGGASWLTANRTLNGAECLVFFLGGVRDSNGAFTGFSLNPRAPLAGGGNRQTPFFEFKIARLRDVNNDTIFFEYVDPMPGQERPYLYLSSYDGRGYRVSEDTNRNGVLDTGEDLNGNSVIDLLDVAVLPTATANLQDVYRQGSSATAPPYKGTSHQIISPGPDQQYGIGGPFNSEASDRLPKTVPTQDRSAERDNVTNFHNGMLDR